MRLLRCDTPPSVRQNTKTAADRQGWPAAAAGTWLRSVVEEVARLRVQDLAEAFMGRSSRRGEFVDRRCGSKPTLEWACLRLGTLYPFLGTARCGAACWLVWELGVATTGQSRSPN